MVLNLKAFWFVVMLVSICYQTQADELLKIFIKSKGCDDEGPIHCGASWLRVNGVDHAKKRRGHNVVVVNGDTGVVESSKIFDTYSDPSSSQDLINHLKSIQSRKLVLIAVHDEGSARMTDAAYYELIKLGAVNPQRQFRGSYALLGWSGPGELDATTQVQRDRYLGPSIISKVLSIPL